MNNHLALKFSVNIMRMINPQLFLIFYSFLRSVLFINEYKKVLNYIIINNSTFYFSIYIFSLNNF